MGHYRYVVEAQATLGVFVQTTLNVNFAAIWPADKGMISIIIMQIMDDRMAYMTVCGQCNFFTQTFYGQCGV